MHLKLYVLTLAVALVSSGPEGESTPSRPSRQPRFRPALHWPTRTEHFKGFKGSFSRDTAEKYEQPLSGELEELTSRPQLDPKLAASILKEVAAHRSALRRGVFSKISFENSESGYQRKLDRLDADPDIQAKLAYLKDFINNPREIKWPEISHAPVYLKIRSRIKGVKGDRGGLNEPTLAEDGKTKLTDLKLKLKQLQSRRNFDSRRINDERRKDFEPSSASDNLSILSEIEPLLRKTDGAWINSVNSDKKFSQMHNVNSIDKNHEQSSYCIQQGNNLVSVMGKGLKADDQSLVCISDKPIQKIVIILPVTQTDASASALGLDADGNVKINNITISLNDLQHLKQLFEKYNSEKSIVNAEQTKQLCSQFCKTRHEKGYKPPPPLRTVQSAPQHSHAPSPVDLGFAPPESPLQVVDEQSPLQTEEYVQKGSLSKADLPIAPLAESVPVAVIDDLNTYSQPSRKVVEHIKRSFKGVDVSGNSDVKIYMHRLDKKFGWKNNVKVSVFYAEGEKIFIASDKLLFKGEVKELCKYRDSKGERNTFMDEDLNVYTSSDDYNGDFTLAEYDSSSKCNQMPARICLHAVELNSSNEARMNRNEKSAALEEVVGDEDVEKVSADTLEARYKPVFSEDFQPGPVYLQKSMKK